MEIITSNIFGAKMEWAIGNNNNDGHNDKIEVSIKFNKLDRNIRVNAYLLYNYTDWFGYDEKGIVYNLILDCSRVNNFNTTSEREYIMKLLYNQIKDGVNKNAIEYLNSVGKRNEIIDEIFS